MKLEEGEVICNKCEGAGCLPPTIIDIRFSQARCPKCHGEGKVDWVTNAMNKENVLYEYKTNFIKFASEILKADLDKSIIRLYENIS